MLTDMSCAKKIDNHYETKTIIGLPHYMAPEMVEGK
jgi:serine/threonine protein kinase